MNPKKQDKQDIKQDIKQGQEPRAYCEAGQAGHRAHVYREIISPNTPAHTPARARIGVFLRPACPASYINKGFLVLLYVLFYVLLVLLFNSGVKKP